MYKYNYNIYYNIKLNIIIIYKYNNILFVCVDYKIHYEKKLKESNFNSNSKESVKHIRNARGISGSNRYLRPGKIWIF